MGNKVLFISSINPIKGPGTIGLDYVNALRKYGYNVDFLTKYKVDKIHNIKYVYPKKKDSLFSFIEKIRRKLFEPYVGTHYLFYRKESSPPVKINKILKKIDDDYDILIIYFWQGLLSYRTVEAIYDKMKKTPKVMFFNADYSTMTGGCHFIGDCTNYRHGCGYCPMLRFKHKNDFTSWNVKDRIRINAKIKPIVRVNSYMKSFFEKSPVMQSGAAMSKSTMLLDLDRFRPINRDECKSKLHLHINESKFIILFGCQGLNEDRKGIKYLLRALDELYDKMSSRERDDIVVMTIGRDSESISDKIRFDQKHLGYINIDDLPYVYALADIFVSPSINDAGPSMVNQSIACGTPVVSFEMGTALDVIKGTGAGICVPLKDVKGMANAILDILHLNSEEKKIMRFRSRQVAVDNHSIDAVIKSFRSLIQE